MFNRRYFMSALLASCLLYLSSAGADSLEDYIRTKLDGKGTVDSIDLNQNHIVINDRLYILASGVTVFDVKKNRDSSIDKIKVGNAVGFDSEPLPKPTAPYDQLIVRIWILPGTN